MLSIFYRDDDGSALDITAFVNLSDANFKNTTNAEQGSVGTNTFDIDDPDGVLNIMGHRRVWAMEDSAPVGMQMIFWGYTGDQTVTRTSPQVQASRKWTVSVVDINSLLQRKVMAGNDTDRPEETDVERVQWLMTTGEAGFFDDTTTYIDTSNPVDMDAADYNGQMFSNILDDCAQQSGKNYYARFPYDGGISDYRAAVWYGKDNIGLATSDFQLSNVISDVTARVGDGDPGSGEAWVWEPSFDSSENRDPSRVFSGIFGNFDGGYTYRTRSATIAEFANRDTIASWPNVKTLAKAQARGDRELNDLHTQEEVVSTTVLVTPEHVNDAMAGDQISVRYSHMPGFEDFRDVRILNRTVTWVTPEVYQIDYDLTPIGGAHPDIVQWKFATGLSIEFDDPVTEGHTIIAIEYMRDSVPMEPPETIHRPMIGTATVPFITIAETFNNGVFFTRYNAMWYRVVDSTDAGYREYSSTNSGQAFLLIEIRGSYAGIFAAQDAAGYAEHFDCGGAVTPGAGDSVLIVGGASLGNSDGIDINPVTALVGTTALVAGWGGSPGYFGGYKLVDSASGSYSVEGNMNPPPGNFWCGVTAVFTA